MLGQVGGVSKASGRGRRKRSWDNELRSGAEDVQ
jgi:hypothetical protein